MKTAAWSLAGLWLLSGSALAAIEPRPPAVEPPDAHAAASAAYERALQYSSGKSVARDRSAAIAWLRRAATLGHAEAQYRLAAVYSHGAYGLRRSATAAAEWLAKSARQNHADAQYSLGMLYAEGRGVERDPMQALKWIGRAARNGHAGAREALRRAQPALPAR